MCSVIQHGDNDFVSFKLFRFGTAIALRATVLRSRANVN